MSDPPPPRPEERLDARPPAAAPPELSTPPPGAATEPEPAGLGRRLLGGLLDLGLGWLLVAMAAGIAVPEFGTSEDLSRSQEQSVGIAVLIALSVWLNYMVFSEWRWGRTIGKAVVGTRVLRIDGDGLSWNRALARNLLLPVDLVAIFFTVPFNEHRQRVGDQVARTVVMRWREPAAPTIPAPKRHVERQWGGGPVLVGLALLLAITIITAGIASAVDPDLETLGAVLVLQAILASAMVFVPFFIVGQRGEANPEVLGLGPSRHAPVRTAALAYLAYLGCALVITWLLSPEQEDVTRELGVDEGALGAIAAFFLIVVAAPVAEEIFFRGFMFAGIRSHGSFLVAAVVSAAVWGLFHYTGEDSWPVVLQLSIFGVILAAVYERTGSIRPAIALHMLNNAIAFAVLAAG